MRIQIDQIHSEIALGKPYKLLSVLTKPSFVEVQPSAKKRDGGLERGEAPERELEKKN